MKFLEKYIFGIPFHHIAKHDYAQHKLLGIFLTHVAAYSRTLRQGSQVVPPEYVEIHNFAYCAVIYFGNIEVIRLFMVMMLKSTIHGHQIFRGFLSSLLHYYCNITSLTPTEFEFSQAS